MATGKSNYYAPNFQDIRNRAFGRLVALEHLGRLGKSSASYWSCLCVCGATKNVRADHLRAGLIESCGCLMRETTAAGKNRKHGKCRTRVYNIWHHVIRRCTKPNASGYERYGAVGITVCERWRSFENFLADMGEPPSMSHTLDRYPHQKGNYEPDNCRWATMKEQNRNRRSNQNITWGGVTKCAKDWCIQYGIEQATFVARRRKGWGIEEALKTLPGHPRQVTQETSRSPRLRSMQ